MMTVSNAIRARISVRAYTPEPVSAAVVHEILDVARYAPSGGNIQPWKVIAVAGEARNAVIAAAWDELSKGLGAPPEHPIYPPDLWEPHRARRSKVAEDMYEKLGISRDDRSGRMAHVQRNFEFFGAPVGLFFIIDQRMGHGQWAHLGMFIQSVALAAVEHGLGCCIQEAWAQLRPRLKQHFGLQGEEMIYCGMALGHVDGNAAVNRLRTERATVEEFATFLGF